MIFLDDDDDRLQRMLCSWGFTAPIIAAVAAAVGTGVSVSQSQQQAEGAAKLSKRQGEQAQANANAEAEQIREQNEHVKSRQRLLVGASGVQGVGSPLDVMIESSKQGELQAQQAIAAGKMYAGSEGYQAELYRKQGRAAGTQGAIGIAGKGIGLLANMYANGAAPSSTGGGTAAAGSTFASSAAGRYSLIR